MKLASTQFGVVTWEQLVACGLRPTAIHRRVRSGVLHRLHRGVYVIGHRALAPMAKEFAAQAACGAGAIVSHRSAAYLWGLVGSQPFVVDVALVGRHCRPKPGIQMHRPNLLDPSDIRNRGPLLLTSPARTAIDMAARLATDELEKLIAEARVRGLLRDGELEAALERASGSRGAGAVRGYLAREGGPVLTRSGKERLMRRLARRADLPQPQSNARVAGYEVDFLWPEQRVIVEVDSYRFHGHRRAFESDRRKSMRLADAGYIVIRVTAEQLVEEPFVVVAHIARALERAASGRP